MEAVLRGATVDQLMRGYEEMRTAAPSRDHRVNFLPFTPSPERRVQGQGQGQGQADDGEEVFLPHDPEYLVVNRAVPSVPVLMGITSQEALLRFCNLSKSSRLTLRQEPVTACSQGTQ